MESYDTHMSQAVTRFPVAFRTLLHPPTVIFPRQSALGAAISRQLEPFIGVSGVCDLSLPTRSSARHIALNKLFKETGELQDVAERVEAKLRSEYRIRLLLQPVSQESMPAARAIIKLVEPHTFILKYNVQYHYFHSICQGTDILFVYGVFYVKSRSHTKIPVGARATGLI